MLKAGTVMDADGLQFNREVQSTKCFDRSNTWIGGLKYLSRHGCTFVILFLFVLSCVGSGLADSPSEGPYQLSMKLIVLRFIIK